MSKLDNLRLAPIILFALFLPACGDDDDVDTPPKAGAAAVLGLGVNTAIHGTVTFTRHGFDVSVAGTVVGLAPDTVHGFHVHEFGDCSDPTGMSAGGHWNPGMHMHGGPTSADSHLGDLGNIESDEKGVATFTVLKRDMTVRDGSATDVIGHAIIVHADPDDLVSQPVGNAGARLACGVVK